VELALFAVWCFVVAAVGGLVGLVLGNLRLPATLLVASSPAAGTGANLVVSAAAAATATIAHLRGGRVDWRLFAWMAPPSIVGAALGGYLSGVMPTRLLLGFITLVIVHAAWELFHWRPRTPSADGSVPELDRRAAVVTGGIVGLLGGVVGLILGSLRMPALVRYVHVPVARAAGTNTAVGFVVGVAGALGHLPSDPPDWTVALVGAAASVPGAWVGSHLTGRLSEPQLIRTLAWVLVVVAVATGIETVA
jgi:uncharacterized protein